MNTGYWSNDPQCVHLYYEKDGQYILSMCALRPDKIWGVEGEDCEKCEHRIMDGGTSNERLLV